MSAMDLAAAQYAEMKRRYGDGVAGVVTSAISNLIGAHVAVHAHQAPIALVNNAEQNLRQALELIAPPDKEGGDGR